MLILHSLHFSILWLINLRYFTDDDPPTGVSVPHIMRSLPSAEFLRLVDSADQSAGSPLSSLSFDFAQKKQRRR
jgi:hypothetical protein